MKGSMVCLRAVVLPMSLLFLSACGDTSTALDSTQKLPDLHSVRSLEVDPYFATIQPGDTLRMTVCWGLPGEPMTPIPEVLEPFLSWSSSQSSRASVTDDGLVLAKSVGFTWIYVVLNPWPDGAEGYPPYPHLMNSNATATVQVRY